MIYAKIFIISALFGTCVYLFLCGVFRAPTGKAKKALDRVKKRTRDDAPSISMERLVANLTGGIAKRLRLGTFHQEELRAALAFCGIEHTPQEHVARSLALGISGCSPALLTLPLCIVSPIIAAVVALLFLGIGLYFGIHEYESVKKMMREQRKRINAELPQFAASISEILLNRRGLPVIDILTEYRKMAGVTFCRELDRTIADMKTGYMESALLRLDRRVGSIMMSEIVRGLVGILRGDDEVIYFQTIAENLRDQEIAAMRKEASILPGKIRSKSMILVFCALALILVMLGITLVNSMAQMQGW